MNVATASASSPARSIGSPPVRTTIGAAGAVDAIVDRVRHRWELTGGSREAALETLAAQVDRTAPEAVDLAAYVGALHVEDLFLASAVASGSVAAAAELRAAYQGSVQRALRSARLDAATAADVAQKIWERVLCGSGERLPSIASYSGRGALGAWLHVSVVREALHEQAERSRFASEPSLENVALATGSAELEYMKGLYADRFRAAFREALAALPTRDRNLLRYTYIDGLSADRVAELYGVHRVSVARWLSRAREMLAQETRRVLSRDLGLQGGESESVLRLIESRLDMSLSSLARDA